MRKLHLLLSVTMLTVTVQAQNEAKENTTLSTEKKELLAQSGKVVPYPLQVAYDQTTHLIFPASIRYVDLGSENLVADKVKDAENVLRVKAAKTDFTDSTNLSVITQDGGFYSFEVSYHTTPQPLTIDFGRGMPQGNNVLGITCGSTNYYVVYLSSEEELHQAYRFGECRYTMATKRHLCTQ